MNPITVRATTTAMAALTALAATTLATTLAAPAAHSATAPDPFSGERRIMLAPEGQEFALAVDRSGGVTSTDRGGRRALFVPTEVRSGRYWLQTAELRRGGEPLCLKLTRTRVIADACDASARHQQFRFVDAGETSSGDPTYTIRTGASRYLVVTDEGGFAPARIGEGTPDIDTPFLLVDRGPASLPALV